MNSTKMDNSPCDEAWEKYRKNAGSDLQTRYQLMIAREAFDAGWIALRDKLVADPDLLPDPETQKSEIVGDLP